MWSLGGRGSWGRWQNRKSQAKLLSSAVVAPRGEERNLGENALSVGLGQLTCCYFLVNWCSGGQ